MKLKVGTELIAVPEFIAKKLAGNNKEAFDLFITQLLSAQEIRTKAKVMKELRNIASSMELLSGFKQ
jgi:hypothetical protein